MEKNCGRNQTHDFNSCSESWFTGSLAKSIPYHWAMCTCRQKLRNAESLPGRPGPNVGAAACKADFFANCWSPNLEGKIWSFWLICNMLSIFWFANNSQASISSWICMLNGAWFAGRPLGFAPESPWMQVLQNVGMACQNPTSEDVPKPLDLRVWHYTRLGPKSIHMNQTSTLRVDIKHHQNSHDFVQALISPPKSLKISKITYY